MKDKKIPGEFSETVEDNPLWKTKREGQARSRQLVKDGIRTIEDNFFISREMARKSKVTYK